MALSGSSNFNLQRDDLIKAALRQFNAIEAGASPSTVETTDASEALNAMVKAWQMEGIGIWLEQEIHMFFANDTVRYTLGPTGDFAAPATDIIKTEVSAAGVAGNSTFNVDSTAGMTAGDCLGIELDDNTLQWMGIDSVTSATVLALSGTLTSAAAVDNHVYTYTGPTVALGAAEASGQTVLTMGNTEWLKAGQIVGIVLDDSTIDWTTITTVDSTTQITVGDALSGNANNGTNKVHSIGSAITRPINISEARMHNEGDNEWPLSIYTRQEYMEINDKASESQSTIAYYQPARTNGIFRVWSEPESVKDRVVMTIQKTIEDMDAATNDAEFPKEAFEAIKYNLAIRLCVEWGKVPMPLLVQFAANSKKILADYSTEEKGSVYLQFNRKGH